MSDVMLLGVLRMPPELWSGTALDVRQRHSRYVEAAERIESDAACIAELEAERDADRKREYGYSQETVNALTSERDALLARAEKAEAELAAARGRYEWLADKVLACDYGDNDKGCVGWNIKHCKGPAWIAGDSIDKAIDAARGAA